MSTGDFGEERTTDRVIKSAQDDWLKRRLREHLSSMKRHSFHTSKTFMDYLHGDVDEGEAEDACLYEYARESTELWQAAEQRDESIKSGDGNLGEIVLQLARNRPPPLWGHRANLMSLLMCESFPREDWNALSEDQRAAISMTCRKTPVPLPMTDVLTLAALGVFDSLLRRVRKRKAVVDPRSPALLVLRRERFLPLVHQTGAAFQAVFALDLSKSETELVNQFRQWLRLPVIGKRLARYKKLKTGATGEPLDRLKDLAAWRLYRELNNNVEAANTFANKRRKTLEGNRVRSDGPRGNPAPFHCAREQDGKPRNEADLFGEDADARKAKARAWEHLVEVLPQEFEPPNCHFQQIIARCSEAMQASEGAVD